MRQLSKVIMLVIVALCIGSHAHAASFMDLKRSDIVYAKKYGKTYSGLTAAVTRAVSTRMKFLIVDGGGTWAVTNSLSFPTNLTLLVTPDTLINVSTSKILTVSGFIGSGDWQIFSGPGIVTGPCDNAFVYIDWLPADKQTNIGYLGTPYTSIVTTLILDNRGYADTNWITNLVVDLDTANSNGIMAGARTADTNLSNAVMSWAVATFDTNTASGLTNTFDDISYSNYPYYGSSAYISSGDGMTYASATQAFVIITNWTENYDYGNSFRKVSNTQRYYPPLDGHYMCHVIVSLAKTNASASADFFLVKNAQLESNANVYRQLDKSESTTDNNITLSGSTIFYSESPTNFWHIYMRMTATGYVNYAYLDYSYMGTTNLVRGN